MFEESQHSSYGHAGAPCAWCLGWIKKALGKRTEDSAAIYFLILCNNTPSWLILKGSFVPQNSQRELLLHVCPHLVFEE